MPNPVSDSAFAPRFISYAQNWEDVMLWRALRHVEHGFYIDVGAHAPDIDSVTRAFNQAGWRGINVEPHPFYLDQLRQARPNDINLGVALGEVVGRVTMSLVDGTGLSTADANLMRQHAAAGYEIRQLEVDVSTLAQVWREHVPPGQQVHFLKVDVEGLERAVLSGANWSENRPWIVVVEAMLPNQQVECHAEWEPLLLAANYDFVYADGLNRFYVARERAELAPAFTYPPSVFDSHVTAAFSDKETKCALQAVELQSAEERLTVVNDALAECEAQRTAQAAELHSAMERLAAANGALAESEAQRTAQAAELHSAMERLTAANGALAESEAQRTAQAAELHSAMERLAAANGTLTEIEAQRTAQAAELHSAMERLVVADRVHAELQVSESRCVALTDELQEAGARFALAERNQEEARERIEVAEVSAILARERAVALQGQLDNVEGTLAAERASFDAERSVFVAERAAATSAYEVGGGRLAQCEQALARAEQRIDTMAHEYAVLLHSPWWRVTAPARRLASVVPKSVRGRLRAAAALVVRPRALLSRLAALRGVQPSPAFALNLYPLSDPGQPAEPPLGRVDERVRDRDAAMRWCVNVLRLHPDVRARFPRALSRPDEGFATWAAGEGGLRFHLSDDDRERVRITLLSDPAARARAYLQSRPDVLEHFSLGPSPDEQRGLYQWFVEFGFAESGLTVEEVLWMLMQSRESVEPFNEA